MRKTLLTILLAVVVATPVFASEATQFYGQVQAVFPMGDWGDFAKLGYGPGLGVTFMQKDSLSFGVEASYLMFSTEDIPGADVSWSMIPILAVGKYHLTDSSAYLLGGLGLAIGSSEIEYDDPDMFDFDDSSSDVAIALGAGINATPKMFFEGRFNAISDANSVSLHMGMNF